MGGITVKNKTSFKKTLAYMDKAKNVIPNAKLDSYAKQGVEALKSATPRDSGETAESWDYRIVKERQRLKIVFINNNVVGSENVPVAIMLQYGHASKNGSWVEGLDYINPALRPIFNDLANKIWKEVSKP